ncbi:MAG: alpha/beta fold hydrolase [Mycobacteriales bacterium]
MTSRPSALAGTEESGGGLADAVASWLRTSPVGPLLAGRTATVVLAPPGGGSVTIALQRGSRPRMLRGRVPRPTTVIKGSSATLLDLVENRDSGVAAFLDGRVAVRGDLSLALAMDGVFDPSQSRPARWPTAHRLRPGGVATAALVAGPEHGPRVLLLHGLGATNASLLPLLWDLARDHRVVAPDLPGFGASAIPRCPYSAGWYARWCTALMDELGWPRAALVGNSMGGRIAIEVGLAAGAQVTGLALLAPSPAFRRFRKWVPLARVVRPELAAVPLPMRHRLVIEGIRAMFAVPDRLPGEWYAAAADEFLRTMHTGAGRVAFFSCLRQIYLEDAFGPRGFWTRLPQLSPPALFVWGAQDRLVPASYAPHVRAALPTAHSVVMADCGHVPQFEHPADTAALVRSFLQTVPR